MSVWPYLVAGSVVLLAASLVARDRWAIYASGVVFSAYTATRGIVVLFDGSNMRDAATAAIWVLAAGAIPRQLAFKLSQNMLRVFAIRTFLALSGVCYFWARLADAPRAFGSMPYMASDLLAIAAMLLIWGSVYGGFVDRVLDLVRRFCRRFDNRRLALVSEAQAQKVIGGRDGR